MALAMAWIACEKPSLTDAWQWYNPLNTTYRLPGSVSMNGSGVQRYTGIAQGMEATRLTLQNGHYPALLDGLRTADPSLFFSAPAQMATWGTSYSCVKSRFLAWGGVIEASQPVVAQSSVTVTTQIPWWAWAAGLVAAGGAGYALWDSRRAV
ncbi:MAG: hypothetical protein ACYCU5_14295 [Actinomycetes bacterium]